MKKKSIAIVGVLFATIIIYIVNPFAKTEVPSKQVLVANDYPNLMLFMSDGTSKHAKELPGKCILIVYFPDCDHCQREAKEISNKLKAFEKYNLWFLSTDAFTSIERFSKDYMLNTQPNVHFARIQPQDVYSNFGSIPTPSVYIFSEAGKLVRSFKGETKVDEIIKFL